MFVNYVKDLGKYNLVRQFDFLLMPSKNENLKVVKSDPKITYFTSSEYQINSLQTYSGNQGFGHA
jgi:hypothetical protein